MSRRSRSPARPAPAPTLRVECDGVVWSEVESGRLVPDTAKQKRSKSLATELKSIFLPVGYPDSVRPEYLRFQAFDTLQAACSYLRSILTTSAILRAAGVGEDQASPMAAAVAWVLRDGVGMFGSLLFSYGVGASFDVHVKEWRLFADLINDVGLTLDMLAPLAGSGFAVIAGLAAACKTICGMVAGATRASITAHFALRNNLADVSAKESAQETAVTLLGLVGGSLLAQRMGDAPMTAWLAFIVLTAVHVWANWLGVGCLTFDYINPQRAHLIIRRWRAKQDISPKAIAAAERIWRPPLLWWSGPQIGVGIDQLIDTKAADGGAAELRQLLQANPIHGAYFMAVKKGVVRIALADQADGSDVLRALIVAEYAWNFDDSLTIEQLRDFCKDVVAAGWQDAALRIEHCGHVRVRFRSE